MNLEKVAATARKLDRVINVLRKIVLGCAIAVIFVMVILSAVNALNPSAVIGEDFHMIDVGPLTIELDEALAPGNGAVLAFAWIYAGLGIIATTVIWLAMGYIRDILRPMTEGRPFHRDAALNIKRLGWMSLVLGILRNIGGVVETTVALRHFGISALELTGAVKSITANYTLDLDFVVVFLVLLLLSYIFSYGADLQQLSDETL